MKLRPSSNVCFGSRTRSPRELYKSLNWDRGQEMAEHRRFTLATDIQLYFCTAPPPGSVAATRTPILLRQYFSKGLSVAGCSQAQLNAVARRLNEHSRQTLDDETPAERYQHLVAPIG